VIGSLSEEQSLAANRLALNVEWTGVGDRIAVSDPEQAKPVDSGRAQGHTVIAPQLNRYDLWAGDRLDEPHWILRTRTQAMQTDALPSEDLTSR
jgi:hypothetical protein